MVAHQREPAAGELHPDLMASAGVQPDADKSAFPICQTIVGQPGFFDAGALAIHHEDFVFAAVFE